jgi:hypothetical protein
MDALDAAEQWLRGYLTGRDGMAPEPYLLKVARHSAPLCLTWLEHGRCRGCDRRGSGHLEFRLDHVSGWMRDGRPAVIVNHPYHLTSRDFAHLARAVEQHPGLEVSMPGSSWYGRSTIQIEVWNTTLQDEAEA